MNSVKQMLAGSNLAFEMFKQHIFDNIGTYLSSIHLGFIILDDEYHQMQNGTEPCVLSAPVMGNSNSLTFITQCYEFDDDLHRIKMDNPETLIAGCANIILKNGATITGFRMIPTRPNGGNTQRFVLTSIYDKGMSIYVDVLFDNKRRIREINLSDFSLDQHVNLKTILTKNATCTFQMDHMADALKKANELILEDLLLQK